jgi:signal transduction histidine kinase
VRVTDSGPGVEEDNIENIFDAFYTTKTQGMGLGLSVCHSIIENHGGRIWVENCPGGGAKFSFRLPFRKDDD